MNRSGVIVTTILLLLASCGGKEQVVPPALPAIRAELKEATAFDATFTVQAVNAATVRYGTGRDMPYTVETGSTGPVSLHIQVNGLAQLTDYTLYLQGLGPDSEEGNVAEVAFSTGKGPDALYNWEMRRNAPPAFGSMSLITMGWHNYSPPVWTSERFAPHVAFQASDGSSRWLFDAFLCVDGWDPLRNLSYSITNSRYSATKESWEDLLAAWLGEGGALTMLDEAIENAAAVLGEPPAPRYVIMGVPDPIRYRLFQDKNSPTTYWGALNGRQMDFGEVTDQETACKWYMDRCRERFHAMRFKHLELAGFYILSEELPLDPAFYKAAGEKSDAADSWNWEHKNWEIIVPHLAAYAHSCREGLWWIPYHLAPGYKVWKQLGFDMAFMQPNYYWDHDQVSHPLSAARNAILKYRMGIELEFEYSLVASIMADGRSAPDASGNATFYAKDVPLLRDRVREYMQAFKDTGLYGEIPFAVYSGTDAWHQLATSADASDREMYHELCQFIIESSLNQ